MKDKSKNEKLLNSPPRIHFWMSDFGFWMISFLFILIFFQMGCHPEKTKDENVIYPKLLSTQTPLKYPADAFEMGIQGKTVLRILIKKNGQVGEAKILSSSGSDVLDEAALEMAKSSIYEPGKIDGVVSDFWLHIPFQFKLGGDYKLSEDMDNWTELAFLYQKQIETESEIDKSKPYKDLFYHYQSLAQELGQNRSHKANNYILMVVQKSTGNPWIAYEDEWPLGFLLYEDYIKRYPESEFAEISRTELIIAYQFEMEFLEKKPISIMPYAAIYSLISESLKKMHDQGLF